MTKWKQLDVVLSTEAGGLELTKTLDELNTEAENRVGAGETPADTPMHSSVRGVFEKIVSQQLIPLVVVFASHPTGEALQAVQAAAGGVSVVWLTVGYHLGRQHSDVIEEANGG